MSDFHAAFVWFPGHVRQCIVGDDIAPDLISIGCDEFLVPPARMEHQLGAIVALSPVKAGQGASIRDHHWHLHLEESDFVAVVVG